MKILIILVLLFVTFSCNAIDNIGVVNIKIIGNDIRLSWDSVSGATEYKIYRSTIPYFTPSTAYTTTGNTYYDDVDVVELDTTNYYYKVSASDGVTESAVSGEVGKFDYSVAQDGFTWFSLPLIPEYTKIDSVLDSQITGGGIQSESDIVYYYGGGTQSAWLYEPTQTWYGNLANLIPDVAYSVRIKTGHTDTLLTFVGAVSDTSRKIRLTAGWNYPGVCYPIDIKISQSNLIESGFTGGADLESSDQIWAYTIGLTDTFNAWYHKPTQTWKGDLKEFKAGHGYIMYIHNEFTWEYFKFINNKSTYTLHRSSYLRYKNY